MSVAPNIFPNSSNFTYNIVVGGHSKDKPIDQSGTCKVADPLRHSKDIPHDELPFITTLRSPTQESLESTPNPVEPGTVVAVSWTTGDPTSRVALGQPNEVNSPQSMAGNNPLSDSGSHLRSATYDTNKRTPPQSFREVMDNGALVREKVESGKQWIHNLTRGLPTHAALYPMAGMRKPQIKQIDTAIQKYVNIPGMDILSQLPGTLMNIPNLFNKLTQKQKEQISSNVPPFLLEGMENMMFLMADGNSGGSYISSGRIHEETFMNNMVSLLSNVQTIDDLVYVIDRLRSDSSLWGLENLENIEYKANTVYGQVTMYLDINGNVTMNANSANIVNSSSQSLVSSMGSSQGGGIGQSLFGKAAQLMNESFQRIPPGIREQIVKETAQLTENLKHNELHRKTIGDGIPLPLQLIG